jgi:hypothetical protein
MLQMSDSQLEWTHDFIQTMFPLPEASNHEHDVPLLTQCDVTVLRASPVAQHNMLAALKRMSNFYGVPPFADPHYIGIPPFWAQESRNHNHKRITRIIKSLRFFGLSHQASEFYSGVCAVVDAVAGLSEDGGVTYETRAFWKDALEGPLPF